MNLREGRIGKQEAAFGAAITCTISGIFSLDTQAVYGNGNASYVSSALAAGVALLLFLLIGEAMGRKGITCLSELYRVAFGPVFSVPAALFTACMFAYMAGVPLMRMLMILCRYVYVESSAQQVLLYFIPVLLALPILGLEVLGRTAKIFFIVIMLSLILTFVIAAPAFRVDRLYPLLGSGLSMTFQNGLTGMARFFPAFLSLLICGAGVHGVENAASGASVSALVGGTMTVGTQLCLGMTYPYAMLAEMHAPVYRATMAVRSGGAYLRTDKLLLFFWTAGALLSGGWLVYAGSLLYAKSAGIRDIRPVAVVFALAAVMVALFGNLALGSFERVYRFLLRFAWLFLLLPPFLAAMLAVLRKEKA